MAERNVALMRRALRRAVGNAYVLSRLIGQRALPFAPRAHIERLRDARVRRIVRYAAATVPHYRELFRRLALDPRAIRGAPDLERLPLIEKDQVRRDPERFVSTSWLGRTSIPFVTSGSTGEPTRIHHDVASLLANIAFGVREHDVPRRLLGDDRRYREAMIGYPGGTIDKVLAFYDDTTFLPMRPTRLFLSVNAPLRENAEALRRFRPAQLSAYGSYLDALERAVAAGHIELPPLRLLRYGAEGIPLARRQELEATFGAPLLSLYNAVECFKIAFLCERRRGFHVHEDLTHLRILGADGGTASDGEHGCVVLSNLVNRGTVLLNYRLSDVSSFATEPCGCGRTLRALADIDGRVEDMLRLAGGEVLHPRAVWAVIKPRGEILQYQLVQRARDDFLLRLVVADAADYDRSAPALAREIAALLGDGARVATARCDDLPRESGGKVRMVVALPESS